MRREPVTVECYEGARSRERPRRVVIEDVAYSVTRVLEQSLEEDLDTRARLYRYRVQMEDGSILSLVRDDSGNWYLAGEPAG